MLNIQRIKWVFFDVGFTLVSEEEPARVRFGQIAAALKQRGIQRSVEEVRAAFENAWAVRAPVIEEHLTEQLAPDAPDRDFLARKAPWRSDLEQPFPGSTAVLRAVRQRFHVGVIANQSAGTHARLCGHGWGDLIELCISSTEEDLHKPDPAIFQLALRRAGCKASEAVMVGDRLDNDIRPAKALGMQTIRVRQGFAAVQSPVDDAETPDVTVDRIDDVPAALGIPQALVR
jgi:HAD superfamily hydrolase (TIGR01549 family)